MIDHNIEHMRRKMYIEVYSASVRTKEISPHKRAAQAVLEFDEKYPLIKAKSCK